MSILELELQSENWQLDKTLFGPVNLLVGNSGVGKTRILRALQTIKASAIGAELFPAGYRWSVSIETGRNNYVWIVETTDSMTDNRSGAQSSDLSHGTSTSLLREVIYRDSKVLVERDAKSFRFDGKSLPKLNTAQSAVSLLQNEEAVFPLFTSLSRVVASDQTPTVIVTDQVAHFSDIGALRDAVSEPLLLRVLALQTSFPDVFDSLKQDYIDIFPTVQDVRIGRVAEFDPHADIYSLTIGIKEQSVDGWIVGRQISSGMQRTLVRLIELMLAPSGTVFLIDEVENSLGINCLGAVMDRINQKTRDLQFIMTSHHPYIINNISSDDWRIVTRRGSTVTVKRASDVPALRGQSAMDKFIRLINSPEFEEGVQ